MKITVAKSAGFCFGVSRAIDILWDCVEKENQDIYTLGPIIHNPQMIASLEKNNVFAVKDFSNIDKDKLIVIRTHGIEKDILNQLQEKSFRYIDATCPFVKKIHKIVKEQQEQNKKILIAGDPEHPEVKGIVSYAKDVFVFKNLEELKKEIENNAEIVEKDSILVAQTTFSKKEWKKINEYLRKLYTNVKIFDTICVATDERQNEAQKLAKENDAMIVIGGKESSNTTKLFEICSYYCPNSFHIETAKELPDGLEKYKRIGITAGASTPDDIIKEVLQTMSEKYTMDEATEISFEEALEESLRPISNGDIVTGIITAVAPNEITVDLGAKQAGYIAAAEFSADPSVKLEDSVKVGDEIEVQVVRLNDVDGTVMLSRKRIESAKAFETVAAAVESKETIDAVVTENVNAGVIASHKGVNIFVPASQTGIARDGDLSVLLNQKVKLKVIDVQSRGRRKKIIGSIKAATRDIRKENEQKLFADIEVGKKYTGTVKSFTSFGAFVDIGGVDGLVHISELSWLRIKHPSEVLEIGQNIEVYIKEFDAEKKRISLGYKNEAENPVTLFLAKYNVGDVIDVKVVRIVPFGAFAEIIPGIDGLIHISQIANERVNKVEDFLKVGQNVTVKITDIAENAKKVSLSIRELLEPVAPVETEVEETVEAETTEEATAEE
ncbi:MAG: bifunctional 4-hydroxy-3-methylbut-2-enyl diphosphate reductase/30S ribosomal protein S1 [Ruminococcaceae bacterium]|nr:bifunctional 4-hydroxy-3-methylbut-2-enyl diphosphate reductase/30S ribosomal protein S1 [Oscillospiraceae bacterium]